MALVTRMVTLVNEQYAQGAIADLKQDKLVDKWSIRTRPVPDGILLTWDEQEKRKHYGL